MADYTEPVETDDIDDESLVAEEQGEGAPEGEQVAAAEEEFAVSLGGEEPAAPAVTEGEQPEPQKPVEKPTPEWVKILRRKNREMERELRTLKRQQAAPAPAQELGTKPTLEGFDYDADKYEQALAAWYEKKRAADDQVARAKAATEEQDRRWREKTAGYERAKLALGAADYEDAEIVVQDMFDVTQQGILVQGAKDAALLVYALGKNPQKAKTLAAIKDPIEFAFAAARLEAQLKVSSNKKPVTKPESRVIGNGRPSGSTDATLERLRADAARTGDFTKVTAYKRSLHSKERR